MASEKYILNIGDKRNGPRAGGVAGSVNPYHVLRELGQGTRVWFRPGSTREAEGTLVVEVRLDPTKALDVVKGLCAALDQRAIAVYRVSKEIGTIVDADGNGNRFTEYGEFDITKFLMPEKVSPVLANLAALEARVVALELAAAPKTGTTADRTSANGDSQSRNAVEIANTKDAFSLLSCLQLACLRQALEERVKIPGIGRDSRSGRMLEVLENMGA